MLFSARFSRHVDIRALDECWPWLAAPDGRGYGVIRDDEGTLRSAHRTAFELEHSRRPIGMVLHSCWRKLCMNPGHLYEGKRPNPRDPDASRLEEIEAGRRFSIVRSTAGEGNPNARLSWDQVREIRR